ncbi:MAG: UDP-N-acetylmuramate dehydrogenase [Planctomycetota bacterium]
MRVADQPEIQTDAPIPTWFRCGGLADRLARPASLDALRRCLDEDQDAVVLGSGANLLVRDEGVGRLVISLEGDAWTEVSIDGEIVHAGAGASLSRLITTCAKAGLKGPETLAGVPATLGGAIAMNAGGRHGEVSDLVESVTTLSREGIVHERSPDELRFGYRSAHLGDEIVVGVTLRLTRSDPTCLTAALHAIMHAKTETQPMGERCAGCAFRNPELPGDVDGIGRAGERIGAGLLIDRAGGKAFASGGARISDVHANFITTSKHATAADVLACMEHAQKIVLDRFGVKLRREVVVWGREG